MVLEYLIEKMGWLTAENNTDKFSLTREGKKYLDSLSK
jgi:predicted transcriptional regulator